MKLDSEAWKKITPAERARIRAAIDEAVEKTRPERERVLAMATAAGLKNRMLIDSITDVSWRRQARER